VSDIARPQENKMGVMPVGKLLITMSLPIIISMLVQALYNIVDSVFVAKISEDALTAVSLAFPAQNLMIAVATGTGVGVNALLSRSLGEKAFERANRVASTSVFLSVCSYVVFALLGLFAAETFYAVQTTDPEIYQAGVDYLRICLIGSLGIFIEINMERLLQATGKTVYSMVTQLAGAIINIVLDPILIFGLLGFPAMGVAGAAWATIIGQIAAAALGVYLNQTRNREITVRLRGFRPDGHIIGRIYAVGIPSIIMASIGSVMTFGMNKILIAFTPTATAVFGVYFKLQSFVFMPVFGLNNGVIPIVAYNYGARKKDRILQTVRLSIAYAVGIMLTGLAVFWIFPDWLLGFFDASEQMLAIGVPALRIISLSFTFAGFGIGCSSLFQALGHGMMSLTVSTVRQLCVLLPSAYVLAKTVGLDAVWWAFPFAELFSVALCSLFLYRVYVNQIRPLGLE